MLVQLHLRNYDDADIIEYLSRFDKGVKSRTIREALRLKMREEGFGSVASDPLKVVSAPDHLMAVSDAEQPDPELMLGQLLGTRQVETD